MTVPPTHGGAFLSLGLVEAEKVTIIVSTPGGSREILVVSEPWFVAKDVAEALGYV